MKNRKALLSLILVIALVSSLFVIPASADANYKVTKTVTLGNGVVATQYQVSGFGDKTKDKKATLSTVELKPGEYVPFVFNYNAGWSSKLSTNFNGAVSRFGYEPVAVMNGSFFGMANHFLIGIAITDGRITCAHTGFSDNVLAFMPDGTIEIVKSCISYRLVIGGTEVPSGLGYINKFQADNWGDKFNYYDSACGTRSDSSKCPESGIELICKKTNGTDLVVGGTLLAEVIEVKKDSQGNYFNLDGKSDTEYFALFVKNSSSLKKYADVEPGTVIEITTAETVDASREVMEKASSVITLVDYLVKDGVDLTETNKTLGTHNTKDYPRGWTNFGWKEDGTMIMVVNDDKTENRLDQSDIAKTLISLGYNNVVRFDGGGSSGLYVSDTGSGKAGYLSVGEDRAVCDTVMFVKRTSLENAARTEELKNALESAEATLKEEPENTKLKSAYETAIALYGNGNPTYGETAKAFAALSIAGSATADLDKAILAAERIKYTNYSLDSLKKIYDAYLYAKAVRSTKNAANEAIVKATEDLNAAIGTAKNNIAKGIAVEAANYGNYRGNLTDGITEGGDYDQLTWNGINSDFTSDAVVVLDLGKVCDINGVATTVNNWDDGCGIASISRITISFSNDGVTYKTVATVTDKERLGFQKKHFTVEIPEAVGQTRYIKYSYSSEGSAHRTFIMVSEIEAYEGKPNVEKAGFVNCYNTSITTGLASIFTPDHVTDFSEGKCNIKWTQTLFLEWDNAKQGYKVISVKSPNGQDAGTLKEGQIALAVHASERGDDSDANRAYLMTAKVGDYIEFHGIYVDQKMIIPGAFYKIVSANDYDKTYSGVLGKVEYNIPLKGENGGEETGTITGLTVEGTVITGVGAKVGVDEFKTHFSGDVTVEGVASSGLVGTGCKVTYCGKTYTVIVKGDVNGDGRIDTKDYVALRLHILKTKTLTGDYEKAAHVKTATTSSVSTSDYVTLRLAILGKATIK